MTDFLDALGRVPDLLAQHLLLAMSALVLGIILSLPLAVWSARVPSVGRIVLGFASMVQTIPSLALLALFYPILLSLSTLVGGGIPALGFLPSLLALTLYALLPILRNGVTGLAGIDPAVIEAADGVGMTAWQKLRLVEAPLVAPVLMAGIRTAAVWTIGAATLSTTVGQPSLGDMIFAGLQTQNWALVLAGCTAAAGLALAVDALLGVIERGIARRKRLGAWIAFGALALGVVIALLPVLPVRQQTVTIGAKGFSEQYILARMIGHRLEAAGYRVRYKEGLGSGVMFAALTSSDVDVAVDYTGTIWTNEMKRADTPPRDAMVAAIRDWQAKQGLNLLGRMGFENAYAFAMRGDRAGGVGDRQSRRSGGEGAGPAIRRRPRIPRTPRMESGARRLSDPFRVGPRLQPDLHVSRARKRAGGRDLGFLVRRADRRGQADRAERSQGAIPNYDAILIVAPHHAKDARMIAALKPLIGRVPVEAMREANYMVDRDVGKVSPDAAARWLEKKVGL